MKTLYEYCSDPQCIIDGHIHLFDYRGVLDSKYIISDNCIGFMDIEMNNLDKYGDSEVEKYYDDFITNHYDPSKHILLATGVSSEQMINLHKKYPDIIKGFGEIKCYGECKTGELPYYNLDWFTDLLEYNKQYNLPVYIHYDIKSMLKLKDIEELVQKYPFTPFVLCHCGIPKEWKYCDDAKSQALFYATICNAVTEHGNLYVDISYTATDFLNCHEDLLKFLPKNKILIGTDINNAINIHYKEPAKIYQRENEQFLSMIKTLGCPYQTYHKLFRTH